MSNWDAILLQDSNRPLLPIEQERLERIRKNQQRMSEWPGRCLVALCFSAPLSAALPAAPLPGDAMLSQPLPPSAQSRWA